MGRQNRRTVGNTHNLPVRITNKATNNHITNKFADNCVAIRLSQYTVSYGFPVVVPDYGLPHQHAINCPNTIYSIPIASSIDFAINFPNTIHSIPIESSIDFTINKGAVDPTNNHRISNHSIHCSIIAAGLFSFPIVKQHSYYCDYY